MAEKRNILIQLDPDAQPSVFDRIVALDAGADEVFSYGGVKPEQVQGLVHGAIFTRGPSDLKHTAIFIGGSDAATGERLLEEVKQHLLPQFKLQVSVLLDPNGANTTAAAAVRTAGKHVELASVKALVLGGTGPVGQRVAHLLGRAGADVNVGSRDRERAAQVCARIRNKIPQAKLTPFATGDDAGLWRGLEGRTLVIAAGAAGVQVLSRVARLATLDLRVAIDLNAVPPAGIEGVEVMDRAAERDGMTIYGAIGVGDMKMRIHKAAVARLFKANNLILDVEEIYQLASGMT